MAPQSFYHVLGVLKTADTTTIKKAYFRLSMLYHPDKAGEASTAKFQTIQGAYEVLSDPKRRKEYDATLKSSSYKRPQSGYPSPPFDDDADGFAATDLEDSDEDWTEKKPKRKRTSSQSKPNSGTRSTRKTPTEKAREDAEQRRKAAEEAAKEKKRHDAQRNARANKRKREQEEREEGVKAEERSHQESKTKHEEHEKKMNEARARYLAEQKAREREQAIQEQRQKDQVFHERFQREEARWKVELERFIEQTTLSRIFWRSLELNQG